MSARAVQSVEFVPLFVRRSRTRYWCQLCPATFMNRDRHGAEHEEAGEATRDGREWITTRKLADAYEQEKRLRALRGTL